MCSAQAGCVQTQWMRVHRCRHTAVWGSAGHPTEMFALLPGWLLFCGSVKVVLLLDKLRRNQGPAVGALPAFKLVGAAGQRDGAHWGSRSPGQGLSTPLPTALHCPPPCRRR